MKDNLTMGKGHFSKIWIFFMLVPAFFAFVYLILIPDISRLKKENPAKSAFMEYRERQWKEKGRKVQVRQVWVALSRISPYLVKAVLIAEDDKFWSPEGFERRKAQPTIYP